MISSENLSYNVTTVNLYLNLLIKDKLFKIATKRLLQISYSKGFQHFPLSVRHQIFYYSLSLYLFFN
ncbi:hypothetical protein BN173_1340110 [Clostridioides difficile T11]|nr:hypothetical protein BN173_1340110 [Clostridioides difficile T11]CCL29350.1 hypothetical protein BN174_1320030 [Clostridioides difficile E15]